MDLSEDRLVARLAELHKKVDWLYQNAALRDVARGETVRVPVKVVKWGLIPEYDGTPDTMNRIYWYDTEFEAKNRNCAAAGPSRQFLVARVEWEE